MHSQQISYFLSMCETLSFTQTAAAFHVTQPVISRQVAALEEELGVILFQRTRHSVALTSSGEIMRDYFEKHNAELKSAIAQARRAADSGRAHLSVRLLDMFDNGLILNAIGHFPHASFYVERHTAPCSAEDLVSGRYDVGVCFKDALDGYEGLEYRELYRGRDCLLSASDYDVSRILNGTDTAPIPMYAVSDDMKVPARFSGARVERLREHGIERYEFALMPNLTSVLAGVESGLGVCILMDFSLPYIRFPHSSIPLDMWNSVGLAWRTDPKRPYIKQFVDACFSGRVQRETNSSNT